MRTSELVSKFEEDAGLKLNHLDVQRLETFDGVTPDQIVIESVVTIKQG